jgi:hypothetical protein
LRIVQTWFIRLGAGLITAILAFMAHQFAVTALGVAFKDENDKYWGLEVSDTKKRLVTRESFNNVVEEAVDIDGDKVTDILRVHARKGKGNADFYYEADIREKTVVVNVGEGAYQGVVSLNVPWPDSDSFTLEPRAIETNGSTFQYVDYDLDTRLDVMIKRRAEKIESVLILVGTKYHQAIEEPMYLDGHWRAKVPFGDQIEDYILSDYDWKSKSQEKRRK